MLHRSELGEHARHFPADQDGNVPEPGDHWSDLNFDHGPNDPLEAGISQEERARRTAWLNEHWWPSVIEQVNQEKHNLVRAHGINPIQRWREEVIDAAEPPVQHGFQAGDLDEDA